MNLSSTLILILSLACSAVFAAPQVSTKEVSGADARLGLTYRVTVAAVSGLHEPTAARVNAALEALAWEPVKAMRAGLQASEPTSADPDGLPAPALPPRESSVDVAVVPRLINDAVLSFEVSVSTYSAGAAHPNSTVRAAVFSAGSGDQVGLDALLDQEGPATLLEAGIALLRERFPDEFAAAEIQTPTALSVVIPTETGFELVWNQYEIAPYYLGAPTVEVPYANLNELILFDARVATPSTAEPAAPKPGIEDALEQD